MTGHGLRSVARAGAEQWRAVCVCGHRGPVVGDRRTAAQSNDHHQREQAT